MAAARTKSRQGFSWIISYGALFTLIILISMLPSSTTARNIPAEIPNNKGLPADDYRILKSMMYRCVEIFLDPYSLPPQDLLQDELIRVKELNLFRCTWLFSLVGESYKEDRILTPHCVHRLKDEVPGMWKDFSLVYGPDDLSRIYGHDQDEDLIIEVNESSKEKKSSSISDEDSRVLRPTMEQCVQVYLNNAADGVVSERTEPCGAYFWAFGLHYTDNQLAPEIVELLKEFPHDYEKWLDRAFLNINRRV